MQFVCLKYLISDKIIIFDLQNNQQLQYGQFDIINNIKMISSTKSRRYDNQNIDFIIPFLINQSVQQSKSPQPQRKRFSIPSYNRINPSNDLQQISKIYNIKNKKRERKKINISKTKSKMAQETVIQIRKIQSASVHCVPGKIIKQTHRFFKAHSQINHPPASQFSPKHHQHSHRQIHSPKHNQPHFWQITPSKTQKFDDSPIMGIKFKTRSNLEKNQSTQLMQSPSFNSTFDQFKMDTKKQLKFWKQKRDWDKMRGLNVDSIINRNCKNFNQMINQYRRRMKIDQGTKIFVFDSKDLWMKRVLIENGWVQNNNKHSKAFHLHWCNKPYKDSLFAQQYSNHYPHCYLITTKTGLHNLLRKYDLTKLQPKTFDLATERQEFLAYYSKLEFMSIIKKLLQKFQFQDPFNEFNQNDLKKQIIDFVTSTNNMKLVKHQINWILNQIIKHCAEFLENQLKQFDKLLILELLLSINSQSLLSTLQEQAIRVIRDFQHFVSKSTIIANYSTIGSQNLWLTKSKISSKGVGISLHNDIESLLKHQNRLAQKYIQSPLIFPSTPFNNRKFDLRIWVLLLGKTPNVYYHQRFYGRICYDSYSVDPQSLKNDSIHLTNYSHNKERFVKRSELSESIVLPQMLFGTINQTFGIDYRSKFYRDVQSILKKMLIIFRTEIANKETENNLQLFGFDLLLDSNLHLHLLQVNLAAHCQQRHQSLTEMLESMGKGILNLIQDRELQNVRQLNGWKVIQ